MIVPELLIFVMFTDALVESGSNEIDEETMIAALQFGHEAIQPIVATQLEMAQAMGKAKRDVQLFTLDESLVEKVSHRIADEWNLGKEEDQTMTQPFGNFHAIPLNLGKTKELCSDTGQQTSLPIASMQQNPEQLGRYRTRPLPPRLLPLRT